MFNIGVEPNMIEYSFLRRGQDFVVWELEQCLKNFWSLNIVWQGTTITSGDFLCLFIKI